MPTARGPQHPGLGTGAGAAERRPRLGPQHGQPPLYRSDRPRQRALHPRQRQGKLPDAGRSSGHRPADRPGSGRRHLRLVVRRRRRPRQSTLDCAEPINFRARYGRTDRSPPWMSPAPTRRSASLPTIEVRDIFIAGLGDSIASGEGNPDRAIALADEGFCFRSYLGTAALAILPPEPRRLQRRPRLRSARHAAELAAPQRAVVQLGLPSLALQLPDPHRAGARRAISAHRGDLSAARLHRRHHRRRPARLAARARMPDRQNPAPARAPSTRRSPNCAKPRRGETPAARPQARPRAAVDRRQRHQFFRPGRRRDRRHADRARAVPAQRRDRIGRRFPRGADARPAARICASCARR